jgi:hypothetical protein
MRARADEKRAVRSPDRIGDVVRGHAEVCDAGVQIRPNSS